MARASALRPNNRTANLIGGILFAVGLVMLVICAVMFVHRRQFAAVARSVQGEVVAIPTSYDRDNHTTMYGTRVSFSTSTGRELTFESSFRSSSPRYHAGEAVTVQYDPDHPEDAQIASTMEQWFGVIVLGGLGTLFVLVGGLMLYFNYSTSLRRRRLEGRGRRVQATIIRVEANPAVEINNRNPWRIICQWQDPSTGRNLLFHSANLWSDPTPHVGSGKIDVLIDPEDTGKYVVDTAFMPE